MFRFPMQNQDLSKSVVPVDSTSKSVGPALSPEQVRALEQPLDTNTSGSASADHPALPSPATMLRDLINKAESLGLLTELDLPHGWEAYAPEDQLRLYHTEKAKLVSIQQHRKALANTTSLHSSSKSNPYKDMRTSGQVNMVIGLINELILELQDQLGEGWDKGTEGKALIQIKWALQWVLGKREIIHPLIRNLNKQDN